MTAFPVSTGADRRVWRLVAGAACALATVQYFIAEALTAAAWRGGRYSYPHDLISDLGVAACLDRPDSTCSPLAWLMNDSLVLQGALTVLTAILLAPIVLPKGWRIAVLGLAFLHGAGVAVVGLVPAGQDGFTVLTVRVHVVGAAIALSAGNLAAIVSGLGVQSRHGPNWFSRASVALGCAGLGGCVLLLTVPRDTPGLFERVAADTITVWTVTVGFAVIRAFRCASTVTAS